MTRPDQATQAVPAVQVSREVVSRFALRIDSNRKLLDNLAVIGFYGLPLDYLDTWSANVGKVTVGSVRAAMKRHLKPENFATVIVGAP